MQVKWKTAALCIAIPLLLGSLSGWISRQGVANFSLLNSPPLTPPAWVFPIVWTILYILMGIASYCILTAPVAQESIRNAMELYALQLAVQFFWSIIFFNLQLYFFAFVWIVILWVLIVATIRAFSQISKCAAYCMLPYLLWVTFAGYLCLGFAILN